MQLQNIIAKTPDLLSFFFRICLLGLLLIVFSELSEAQPTSTPGMLYIAVPKKITGHVYIFMPKDQKEERPESPISFTASPSSKSEAASKKPLPPGHYVLSAGKIYIVTSKASLWLSGGATLNLYVKIPAEQYKRQDVWISMPQISKITKFIEEHIMLTGGRPKGDSTSRYIVMPDDHFVRPSAFYCRWKTDGNSGSPIATIILSDSANGYLLGKSIDVSFAAGKCPDYVLQEMRSQLDAWRDKQEKIFSDDKITLTLRSGAITDIVTFSLIGKEAESGLLEQLSLWNGQPPLLQHMGKAGVLKEFSLYSESSIEYEFAETILPDDPLVLLAISQLKNEVDK